MKNPLPGFSRPLIVCFVWQRRELHGSYQLDSLFSVFVQYFLHFFFSISSKFSLAFIFLLYLSFTLFLASFLRPNFLFSFLLLFSRRHAYKALTSHASISLFLFLFRCILAAATAMFRKFSVYKHQQLVFRISQNLFWASEDVGRFCSHTVILRCGIQLVPYNTKEDILKEPIVHPSNITVKRKHTSASRGTQ